MIKPQPNWVCQTCGIKAHKKTYGNKYEKRQFESSTWHMDTCEACGNHKMVTERRDFFSPKFDGRTFKFWASLKKIKLSIKRFYE